MRTIIGEGGDDDVAGDLGGTLISNEQSLILVDFKKVIMSTLVCWVCEKNVFRKNIQGLGLGEQVGYVLSYNCMNQVGKPCGWAAPRPPRSASCRASTYALGCLGCALSCVFGSTRFHSRMKTAMPLSPALALMRLSGRPASGASGSDGSAE